MRIDHAALSGIIVVRLYIKHFLVSSKAVLILKSRMEILFLKKKKNYSGLGPSDPPWVD